MLPQLVKDGEKFDLIYVDGSHLFEDVFVDTYFAIRCLSDDGVILFDDSAQHHVQKALRFVRANLSASLQEVDLAKYHPTGNSWKYKLARATRRLQLTAFKKVGVLPRAWDSALHDF